MGVNMNIGSAMLKKRAIQIQYNHQHYPYTSHTHTLLNTFTCYLHTNVAPNNNKIKSTW